MDNNTPYILAPVGGEEQLMAALRTGADAVYFGLQNFNARRNASNFNGDNLAETIRLCHVHSCRVFITINTIVFDDEIDEVYAAVDKVALAKADGIITQDLAVAGYIKKNYPNIKLIASTQMAVHNSEGVKLLQDYGFDQIVLARELTLNEIKDIIDKTHADIEVFVHGALCMSLSGNCYLSSMIGARSGNRGLCAQPCRLDCNVCDRDHALSLKDMSYISYIKQLKEAGVSCLKIEGRMKRAEYVAAAVSACKKALNGETSNLDDLKAVFSRSGFTDAYLTGKRNLSMFGYRTKEDVLAAKDVLARLSKLYEKEIQNVPLTMYFTAKKDEAIKLVVSDENNWISVEGCNASVAKSQPMTKEYIEKSMSKLGGSIYYLDSIDVCIDDGIFVSLKELNELRRKGIEALTDKRVLDFEKCID